MTYVTTNGANKTIEIGFGTVYLSDVRYGTQMTINPIAISGYIWDWDSKTITYNGGMVIPNNAYIYPTSVTISGSQNVTGGSVATYTANILPSNVDVGVTYTWSVSGSSNVFIQSTNGATCVVGSNIPEQEQTFILTCVVKSIDNKVSLQASVNVVLQSRPNFITATYNITSTTSNTNIVYSSFSLSEITYMEIDGVEVIPVRTYKFSTIGKHNVRMTVKSLRNLFNNVGNLVSVDFSECNGDAYSTIQYLFYRCGKLQVIKWGNCKLDKITTFYGTFSDCSQLTSIDLSPLRGAPITALNDTFSGCSALTSIDLSPLSGAPITTLYDTFFGCSALTSVDLSPLSGAPITTLYSTFNGCKKLTSIDLSPLSGAPITTLYGTFNGCSQLTSIDLSPLRGAQITTLEDTFYNCKKLTSIDLSPLSGAPITTLDSTFNDCKKLTSIDLSPLRGAPITTLYDTFFGCSALTSVDLSPLSGAPITSLYRTFNGCSQLTSIDLSPLRGAQITTLEDTFYNCTALKTIIAGWNTAPKVSSTTFGTFTSNYTGRNTYSTGENKLYVPTGATGYDSSYWLDPLCNADKCGFTLSKTL